MCRLTEARSRATTEIEDRGHLERQYEACERRFARVRYIRRTVLAYTNWTLGNLRNNTTLNSLKSRGSSTSGRVSPAYPSRDEERSPRHRFRLGRGSGPVMLYA